jgi:RND superfamily putative drug exporter
MVCVFLSFMLGEDRLTKEFGLSLASAGFLDALVIRRLLLPAVPRLVACRTWALPRWHERPLPRVKIEGSALGAAPGERERRPAVAAAGPAPAWAR